MFVAIPVATMTATATNRVACVMWVFQLKPM
jgi:hypothetical protein